MSIVKDNYVDRRNRQAKDRSSREAAWRALTPQQQLADLDRRLGVGVGAMKQRKRIQAAIEAVSQKKEIKKDAPVAPNHSKKRPNNRHRHHSKTR